MPFKGILRVEAIETVPHNFRKSSTAKINEDEDEDEDEEDEEADDDEDEEDEDEEAREARDPRERALFKTLTKPLFTET